MLTMSPTRANPTVRKMLDDRREARIEGAREAAAQRATAGRITGTVSRRPAPRQVERFVDDERALSMTYEHTHGA